MSPLERLFLMKVEFHRKLRLNSPGMQDASAAHTSFALQNGYETLLGAASGATTAQVDAVKERQLAAGDVRDVLAARDSLKRLLGIPIVGA